MSRNHTASVILILWLQRTRETEEWKVLTVRRDNTGYSYTGHNYERIDYMTRAERWIDG
jgi:hypothetical protein